MKPTAGTDAVGFSIWGVGLEPGKALPASQNFYDKTTHAHAHSPQPRLSGSHRGAGLRFNSGSIFFVWQFGSGRNSARAEFTSRRVVNA